LALAQKFRGGEAYTIRNVINLQGGADEDVAELLLEIFGY